MLSPNVEVQTLSTSSMRSNQSTGNHAYTQSFVTSNGVSCMTQGISATGYRYPASSHMQSVSERKEEVSFDSLEWSVDDFENKCLGGKSFSIVSPTLTAQGLKWHIAVVAQPSPLEGDSKAGISLDDIGLFLWWKDSLETHSIPKVSCVLEIIPADIHTQPKRMTINGVELEPQMPWGSFSIIKASDIKHNKSSWLKGDSLTIKATIAVHDDHSFSAWGKPGLLEKSPSDLNWSVSSAVRTTVKFEASRAIVMVPTFRNHTSGKSFKAQDDVSEVFKVYQRHQPASFTLTMRASALEASLSEAILQRVPALATLLSLIDKRSSCTGRNIYGSSSMDGASVKVSDQDSWPLAKASSPGGLIALLLLLDGCVKLPEFFEDENLPSVLPSEAMKMAVSLGCQEVADEISTWMVGVVYVLGSNMMRGSIQKLHFRQVLQACPTETAKALMSKVQGRANELRAECVLHLPEQFLTLWLRQRCHKLDLRDESLTNDQIAVIASNLHCCSSLQSVFFKLDPCDPESTYLLSLLRVTLSHLPDLSVLGLYNIPQNKNCVPDLLRLLASLDRRVGCLAISFSSPLMAQTSSDSSGDMGSGDRDRMTASQKRAIFEVLGKFTSLHTLAVVDLIEFVGGDVDVLKPLMKLSSINLVTQHVDASGNEQRAPANLQKINIPLPV